MRRALRLLIVASLSLPLVAYTRPAPRKVEVAPGVYVFMTAPYGVVGLDGNSVVVLSRDGVLVFDSNGTPDAAAAVLAEIRTMTPLPVRYLVHSHWHWDHWYGAEVYTRAFPDVTVIAHEKTRDIMRGPAIEFNRPGLETQLPDYIRSLERRIEAGERSALPAADLDALREALQDARHFLEQKARVTHIAPTRTYTDRFDIRLGERRIQLLNFGRAVTPGDTVMYLPDERILVTGDVLVNPITFALSSYPTEWLRTLDRLDAISADVIVTGHGEPLRDKTLLRATKEVFSILLNEGKAAHARGVDPDAAKDEILPKLQTLMIQIAGNEPARQSAFRTQLVDWYLHRVYAELSGPLTDAIAPIPPH